MAQVPDKVLAWLYSVLHEYRDPQRTYSDAVRVLASTPTLSPRTEVYTYETGSPALLLTLSGTLPVTFRGSTYRFPVKLWIPHSYPQEPPMVYVTPGKDMLIRPGQHVGVDGKVYHPYLRDWARVWDRATVAELLEYLQQVFAKEPPVISRAQQQQYQRPIGSAPHQPGAPTSIPPQLPPKQQEPNPSGMRSGVLGRDVPPPRPPKPGEEQNASFPVRSSSRNIARDGPPLPPLPHEMSGHQRHASSQSRQLSQDYGAQPQRIPASPQEHRFTNGTPHAPQVPAIHPPLWQQAPNSAQPVNFDRSPVSPISPIHNHPEHPGLMQGSSTVPAHSLPAQHHNERPHQLQYNMLPQYQHQISQQVQQPLQQGPRAYPQSQPHRPQQQQAAPQKQPAPDLLSDPFDVAITNPGPPQPAPPIPPNPEKEHLLSALSTTLTQQAQQRVHQNLSAVAPLQAQQSALRAAFDRLLAERASLDTLDAALTSNEAMLRHSLAECDATIAAATSKPPPPVDDVLIAPTMVANQLWTLCAEEAACREAMYVLQKAIDRGRVSGHDFVRQMRSLGRECFLKMMLARKCARGLGLDIVVGSESVAR